MTGSEKNGSQCQCQPISLCLDGCLDLDGQSVCLKLAMDTVVQIVCLLASLPNPPRVTIFNDINIQAFPVARHLKLCGNVSSDVQFHLYTRVNETDVATQRLRLNDDASLLASHFDRRLPTAFYLHGFGESSVGKSSVAMRDAFLKRGGYNLLMADYVRLLALPWYPTAMANTYPIGLLVARFIDFLAARGGLDLRTLHLVGLSLGAHIAGVAGAALTSGRIGRITGLDPAGPGFDNLATSRRLNPTSARFVDVIHTDGTVLGLKASIGHADFYPNGGVLPQPFCRGPRKISPLQFVGCSHRQSHAFFVRSLLEDTAFPATPCASWTKFRRRECLAASPRQQVFMGVAAPEWARGKYYLSTSPMMMPTS